MTLGKFCNSPATEEELTFKPDRCDTLIAQGLFPKFVQISPTPAMINIINKPLPPPAREAILNQVDELYAQIVDEDVSLPLLWNAIVLCQIDPVTRENFKRISFRPPPCFLLAV